METPRGALHAGESNRAQEYKGLALAMSESQAADVASYRLMPHAVHPGHLESTPSTRRGPRVAAATGTADDSLWVFFSLGREAGELV